MGVALWDINKVLIQSQAKQIDRYMDPKKKQAKILAHSLIHLSQFDLNLSQNMSQLSIDQQSLS